MLDKVKIKLPKKETSIEKFFCNCEKRKKFVEDAGEEITKEDAEKVLEIAKKFVSYVEERIC